MTISAYALVYAMVAWINATGMITPAWPTNPLDVNVTDRHGMASDIMRCLQLEGAPPISYDDALSAAHGMHALYCADRVTIHDAADLNAPEDQAWLVHELVHWLQDYNGDTEAAPCPAAREEDAYAIHMYWQEIMGLEVYPDAFTARIRSQCPPNME